MITGDSLTSDTRYLAHTNSHPLCLFIDNPSKNTGLSQIPQEKCRKTGNTGLSYLSDVLAT